MELRRSGMLVMTLVVWAGCKGDAKKEAAKEEGKKGPGMAEVLARCDQLGKACGDNEKHATAIITECKQGAEKQLVRGCTASAIEAWDCYEKELCGKGDKVWALDDLRVLSERHGKCAAERDANAKCVGP
ncbi:MAG TPA: hypothetical protein VMZ28_19730 [Kofleriaceae bacterium]|nr:hypothetical protein [Kofleriaceae bacterium]